jgi:hypothetical protein
MSTIGSARVRYLIGGAGLAVAVHISPNQMTKEDYERVIADLGGSEPEGRRFHAAYGDDELQIFEVWDSPEQFQDYKETLFEHLQSVGLGGGDVEIHPLRSRAPD